MHGKSLRDSESMKQKLKLSLTVSLLGKRESALEVKPKTLFLHQVSGMLVQKKERQAQCAYISLCNAEHLLVKPSAL